MARVLIAFLIAALSGLPVLALAADVDAAGNPLPVRSAGADQSAPPATPIVSVSADPAAIAPAEIRSDAKPAVPSRSNWKKLLPGNIK